MHKNKNDNTFSDTKFSTKIMVFVSFSFVVLLALSFVLGLFFFSFAGIFRIFGTQYESVSSLLIFAVIYFMIAFVMDFVSIMLFRLLSPYLTGRYSQFFVRMISDCTFSLLSLYWVDEAMNSITIPFMTKLIIVLLLFMVEEAFEDWKNKEGKLN